MGSENLAFVAGIAGFFLGGFAVYQSTVAQDIAVEVQEIQQMDDELLGGLAERITALESDVRTQNKKIGEIRDEERQLRDKVREMIYEFKEFRAWAEEVEKKSGVRIGEAGEAVDIGAVAKMKRRYDLLLPRVLSGEAGEVDVANFWKIARVTGALDEAAEQILAKVDTAPEDARLRMLLANAYTEKLITVTDPQERTVWTQRAEDEWTRVLEIDPDHWQARFNRAFSWSQYPPYVGKAPEAIKEFEALRALQEKSTPEKKHAQVYLELFELYRGQANLDRAVEVLKVGVARHPASKTLQDKLDEATSKD